MKNVTPEQYHPNQVSFRRMTREDFGLLKAWLESDAIREWWHEPTDLGSIEKKYGSRVDDMDSTKSYITLVGVTPIGMMQAYWTRDYPEYGDQVALENAVAFDWFIGDEAYIGHGLGTTIATTFSRDVIMKEFPKVCYVVASPSVKNVRSIHVLSKAGFEDRGAITVPGEADPEELMVMPIS